MIPPAPNLARHPFANTRPVARLALFLWLVGALLLIGNAAVYYSYYVDSADKRKELADVEREAAREQATAGRLEATFAGLDLTRQNEQVEYLNQKIAERAFSWSLLFDRLAEVLPREVRLTVLRPQGVVRDERDLTARRAAAPRVLEEGRVALEIAGEAKDGEALLRFVDNLFAHPAFDNPDLTRESSEKGDVIQFLVRVEYLPAVAETAAKIEEEPARSPAAAAAEPPPRYPMQEEEN